MKEVTLKGVDLIEITATHCWLGGVECHFHSTECPTTGSNETTCRRKWPEGDVIYVTKAQFLDMQLRGVHE